MWLFDKDMPRYSALSYGDKWRVSRSVTRGEAPADWRLASEAVELAEGYQRHRGQAALLHWGSLFLSTAAGCLAIAAAIDGDQLGVIVNALIVVSNIGQLCFNPASRPRNLARSLEASRRLAALGEPGLTDLGVRANQIVESPEGALVNDEASVRRLPGL